MENSTRFRRALGGCLKNLLSLGSPGLGSRLQAVPGPDRLKAGLQTGLFKRALRVLHLVDSLRVGGKERQVVELLQGLHQFNDVQLMVVTMGQEQFYVPEIEKLQIPWVYLLRKVRCDP